MTIWIFIRERLPLLLCFTADEPYTLTRVLFIRKTHLHAAKASNIKLCILHSLHSCRFIGSHVAKASSIYYVYRNKIKFLDYDALRLVVTGYCHIRVSNGVKGQRLRNNLE